MRSLQIKTEPRLPRKRVLKDLNKRYVISISKDSQKLR